MKIVEYNNINDIYVKFMDLYETVVHGAYREFCKGKIKNPYAPSILNVASIGNKYGSQTKEYKVWHAMICRCFDEKHKTRYPAYANVTCCDEWLLFDNFYEWLHLQENFDKWICDVNPAIDKDILFKGNKIYSSQMCSLVPQIVNNLFIKRANDRGDYPIGVTRHGNRFRARCDNPILGMREHIGVYNTPEEAFYAYKKYKEDVIKQVANIEYNKNTITLKCYEAMLKYKVEITD